MAIDYGQLASQYFNRRVDTAMQPFTNTEGYLNNRLQQQYDVNLDEEGNVKPRSTTITNNDDGSQTITTKSEITPVAQTQPVYQPAVPVAPMAAPVEVNIAQPQAMAAPAVTTQPMSMPAPAAPVAQAMPPQTMAQPEVPAAPVAPVAPVELEQPVAQLPQPGPGVQLAGPMVPGAMPAPQPVPVAPQARPSATAVAAPAPVAAPAAAPAPQTPAWSTALQNSQGNVTKLYAIAGNESYPTEVQNIAAQMAARLTKGELDQQQAGKTIEKWLTGDKTAANDVMKDLKREEGSYIKAYLYNRLGFTDLAKQEMQKISPDVKISQSQLDGKPYTVETDNRGVVTRAWDSEGTRQDAKTIAAINAGGIKYGAQAYSFTSGIHTLSSGEPLQARQNSITGATEFVHTIGPKRGQVYSGTEIPLPQRVQTSTQVAYNQKLIDFATNPSIAAATELFKLASAADPGDGSELNKARAQIRRSLGPEALASIPGVTVGGGALPQTVTPAVQGAAPVTQPAAPVAPAAAPATPAAAAQPAPLTRTPAAQPAAPAAAAQPAPVRTPVSAAAPIGGAGGTSGRRPGESFDAYNKRLAVEKAAAEAEIQRKKELAVAEGKPPAEARGKTEAKTIAQQDSANRAYPILMQIEGIVKKSTGSGIGAQVDDLARIFGASPDGAQAIAELAPLASQLTALIPRFEGSQSDRDVIEYKEAAGNFNNPKLPIKERLAGLQGMVRLYKIFDGQGRNDWGAIGVADKPAVAAGTVKKIGGVDYIFDGKGWKKK